MSVIDLAKNEFHLTQEEISFIRTRHYSKQLALALLFNYYQKNNQFINDPMKLPALLLMTTRIRESKC